MDRRDWQATVHRVAKSRTWLKTEHTHTHTRAFQFTDFNKNLLSTHFLTTLGWCWDIKTRQPGVQFSSVAQSCPTLCDPMDYSMPGLPVHYQLLEFTQTHVHWVSDAIQRSHPLSSPSPPAFNLSQHQGLFQWVASSGGQSIGVSASTSVLTMIIQDWFPLGWTGWISL